MATRFNFETGWPMAANMRRIWRVRPSRSVTRSQVLPSASALRGVPETRSISHGRVRSPVEQDAAPQLLQARRRAARPTTLTMYSFGQPVEGCVIEAREVAVVRQEQEPLGLHVEAARRA